MLKFVWKKHLIIKKELILILLLAGGFFFLISIMEHDYVLASSSDNVHGWAWSDTIGWISFNCTEGGPSQTDICATSNYGVTIATSTGVMSGYAWSDNIGWITFNQTDLSGCPSGTCVAQVDLVTGEVSGWARALNSIRTDYGWINLKDEVNGYHGVVIDTTTGYFSNYAWGGGLTNQAVIGWISFNCSNEGTCATANYYVWTDPGLFNLPPYTANRDATPPSNADFCEDSAYYILSWVFKDDDTGAYENTYELQITNTNTGTSTIYSPGTFPAGTVVSSTTQSVTLPVRLTEDLSASPPQVAYGQSYSWQVRVQDDGGLWSTWDAGPSFTVPENYPSCSFTMIPVIPKLGEEVQFQDTSTDGAYPITDWAWDFGDGVYCLPDCGNGTNQNPTHTYYEVTQRTVTLTITDSEGRNCSTSTTFNIKPGNPNYNEVIPR